MSSITIEVSDLKAMLTTVAAEAAASALAKVGVIAEGAVTTSTPATLRQKPKSNSKTRRSATPTAPVSNVRRLNGFFEFKTSTTAASLRKGHVFVLKPGGAMYTVTSVLRTANTVTVATDHPKVEQMTLASEKPVTFCQAR